MINYNELQNYQPIATNLFVKWNYRLWL